jgi:glycosyltransferase 2 family protein
MKKRTRKALIVTGKGLLAGLLLAWVISQVHFRDYVRTREGETYSLVDRESGLDGSKQFVVDVGGWFSDQLQTLEADRIEPISEEGGLLVRPGFFTNLRNVHVGWLALAIGGFAGSMVCIAIRWRMLLQVQEVRIGLWEALRLTVLGEFFNNVVPGTVGGDLVKAYYVSKHTHLRSGVLVSVFIDRLLGLTMLAFLAVGAVLAVLVAGLEPWARIYLSLVASVICLTVVGAMFLFILSSRVRRLFRLEWLFQRLPISHHLAEAGSAARQYKANWPRLVAAVGVTVLAHIAFIGGIAMIGASLSLGVPAFMYLVYIPLIYILGAVPITPGGVGLVEKLYVAFFVVNPAGVLAMALLVRLTKMAASVPGVGVAVRGARLPKSREIEAELGLQEDTQTPEKSQANGGA